MTQDQVFVPKTRSELGLPKFNPDGEDLVGSRVTEEVMRELKEAIGDSPIGATIGFFSYLVRASAGGSARPKPFHLMNSADQLTLCLPHHIRLQAGRCTLLEMLPVRNAIPRVRTVSFQAPLLCDAGLSDSV